MTAEFVKSDAECWFKALFTAVYPASALSFGDVPEPLTQTSSAISQLLMLLYFLFFFSGLSGLIYQVAWVREFGNVFGNTVYSASIVVAVFMLGLGVGSYIAGVWADRRYARQPESCFGRMGRPN